MSLVKANDWLLLAQEHVRIADSILGLKPPMYSLVAEDVHQIAEKTLKGLLSILDINYPDHGKDGHSLKALIQKIPNEHPLKRLAEPLKDIELWYSEFKYPATDERFIRQPAPKTITKKLDDAKKLLEKTQQEMPPPASELISDLAGNTSAEWILRGRVGLWLEKQVIEHALNKSDAKSPAAESLKALAKAAKQPDFSNKEYTGVDFIGTDALNMLLEQMNLPKSPKQRKLYLDIYRADKVVASNPALKQGFDDLLRKHKLLQNISEKTPSINDPNGRTR